MKDDSRQQMIDRHMHIGFLYGEECASGTADGDGCCSTLGSCNQVDPTSTNARLTPYDRSCIPADSLCV